MLAPVRGHKNNLRTFVLCAPYNISVSCPSEKHENKFLSFEIKVCKRSTVSLGSPHFPVSHFKPKWRLNESRVNLFFKCSRVRFPEFLGGVL